MKFLDLKVNQMNGQLEAYFDDWKVVFVDGSHDEIHPTISIALVHKSDWCTGKIIAVPDDYWEECWISAHDWAIEFLEIVGVIDEIP